MRIWSLHPQYLDVKGLLAAWREGLLAQKVLLGRTKGYRNHPQLERFKEQSDPAAAMGSYLSHIAKEAQARGYNFDGKKIVKKAPVALRIRVAHGQLVYELKHLKRKLKGRDPVRCRRVASLKKIQPHPIFRVVGGGVASWEKV